eukprot:445347-Rhodomonas_salina.1
MAAAPLGTRCRGPAFARRSMAGLGQAGPRGGSGGARGWVSVRVCAAPPVSGRAQHGLARADRVCGCRLLHRQQ